MTVGPRLEREFYLKDVLDVAPGLISKSLVRVTDKGIAERFLITETEAYRGIDDLACHASKGRTPRTEIMFHEGGHLYVYFVYGMYWMLNVVTEKEDNPQAVLIRGLDKIYGPGRITKILGTDRTYYGEDLVSSGRIWIEDNGIVPVYEALPRVGIDYAGEYWKNMPWRFRIILP